MGKHRSLPKEVDERVKRTLKKLLPVMRHNTLHSLGKRTRIITGKAGNIVLIYRKRS